ncbi:MAG: hypothetical protein KFB96_01875 [Thiocapsa sp.]|uniref:hypothetical protein n=1 Tax=Thiocapsa sp. TaxID=2024551 RepID=UPI001BCC1891|nr:hypothetical protein [Thiocapsa sp.]QVL49302.1 MAG: hypothetical protein KFB96_01875 [Thiocapsa sp.]
MTDGVANVGETEQRNFLRLLEQKEVRLFTFIMGNSANRPLLEALTQATASPARSPTPTISWARSSPRPAS